MGRCGAAGRVGAGSAGGVTVEGGRRTPLLPGAEFLERAIPPRCCTVVQEMPHASSVIYLF